MRALQGKKRGSDWSQAVYADPDPVQVAKIAASHGVQAAEERWSWLGHRTITTLISEGKRRMQSAA